MENKKITVVARVKAKAGMEEQLKQMLLSNLTPTRAESGCVTFDLHEGIDDASQLMSYENWATKADLDEHLQKPYIIDFMSKAKDILAESPEITLWRQLET